MITRLGLLASWAGGLLLGGCATLEPEQYWAPAYPREIEVYEQVYERPFRNPDGWFVVYDPGPRLYCVVQEPGLYWRDGYYYRRHQGLWERSRHQRGPWVVQRPAPSGGRYGAVRPRPDPLPFRDRRPRRDPILTSPQQDPFARTPSPPAGPGWAMEPGRRPPRDYPGAHRSPYAVVGDRDGVGPPSVAPVSPRQIGGRPIGGPPSPRPAHPPAVRAGPAPRGPQASGPLPNWGPGSDPAHWPDASRQPGAPQDPVPLDGTLTPGWPNRGL